MMITDANDGNAKYKKKTCKSRHLMPFAMIVMQRMPVSLQFLVWPLLLVHA